MNNQFTIISKITLLILIGFFIKSSSANAMTTNETLLQIQTKLMQLSEIITELNSNSLPVTAVVTASSSLGKQENILRSAALIKPLSSPLPLCRVSVDKSAYKIGENINFSWETTGATTVRIVSNVSSLPLPTRTLDPSGSLNIKTNTLSIPEITLQATNATGQVSTCSRVVSIVKTLSTNKIIDIGSLKAQILEVNNQIKDTDARKKVLEDLQTSLSYQRNLLQASLNA